MPIIFRKLPCMNANRLKAHALVCTVTKKDSYEGVACGIQTFEQAHNFSPNRHEKPWMQSLQTCYQQQPRRLFCNSPRTTISDASGAVESPFENLARMGCYQDAAPVFRAPLQSSVNMSPLRLHVLQGKRGTPRF